MYYLTGKEPKYLLRWRFDFSDHKPSVYGLWMSSHVAAWKVNKENLLLAAIEGKNIKTREKKILVACDGHEFCNFKWHAVFKQRPGSYGKQQPILIGMILQTRDQDILQLVDGDFATKSRTEFDKGFNYAAYGK